MGVNRPKCGKQFKTLPINHTQKVPTFSNITKTAQNLRKITNLQNLGQQKNLTGQLNFNMYVAYMVEWLYLIAHYPLNNSTVL